MSVTTYYFSIKYSAKEKALPYKGDLVKWGIKNNY